MLANFVVLKYFLGVYYVTLIWFAHRQSDAVLTQHTLVFKCQCLVFQQTIEHAFACTTAHHFQLTKLKFKIIKIKASLKDKGKFEVNIKHNKGSKVHCD